MSTVALTFDDGPHPDSTPALLDALTRAGVRATFFVCGEQVVRHPELLRALHEAGMWLGNHSHTHPHYLLVQSTIVLLTDFHPHHSPLGIAWTAVTVAPPLAPLGCFLG